MCLEKFSMLCFSLIALFSLCFTLSPVYAFSEKVEVPESSSGESLSLCTYHHLLLIYSSVDVTYFEDGSLRRFSGSMDSRLLSTIISAFIDFNSLVESLSGSSVASTYKIIVIAHPLTKVTYYEGLGYWPTSEDLRKDLEYYAPLGTYDSVFVVWYNGPIKLQYFGIGGMFINDGTAIYSVVASHGEEVWKAGGRPGEVFLHEWLHGVARFFSSLGYMMPEKDADGAEIHGYVWTPEEGWTRYYRDLMQGKVWEQKLRAYTGITKEAWSKHCSPNAERLRTSAKLYQENLRLREEYIKLQNNYTTLIVMYEDLMRALKEMGDRYVNLEKRYNDLESKHNKLNMEFSNLKSDYYSLMDKHAKLEEEYDRLENTYKSLRNEYELTKTKHSLLEEQHKILSEKYRILGEKLIFYRDLAYLLIGILIVLVFAITMVYIVKKSKKI